MDSRAFDAQHNRSAWRMGCYALVAIKRRVQCKSRLAEALAPGVRIQLVRSMLDQVIAALNSAQTVRRVAIVSPERDTVPPDIPVLADTGEGLNEALGYAQRTLLDLGAREILILPADLPFVTSAEIDRLVRAGRRSGFAIAPDARDAGTNGLFLNLQSLFPFQFGEDSKRRHLAAAKRLGLRECVVRAPGLARDIDAPSDIAAVNGDLWQFR